MFAYRIIRLSENSYIAEYKRSANSEWQAYKDKEQETFSETWEQAYGVLEKHATPAALQVKFVGTF